MLNEFSDEYLEKMLVDLSNKAKIYIGLENVLAENYKNLSDLCYTKTDEAVRGAICYYCGMNCKRFCKMAKAHFERMYCSYWMSYVILN